MAKPKRVAPKILRVGQTVHAYDWFGKGVRSYFVADNSTRKVIILAFHFGTPFFYSKSAAERYGSGPRWSWVRGARTELFDSQIVFMKAAQGGARYSSALHGLAKAAEGCMRAWPTQNPVDRKGTWLLEKGERVLKGADLAAGCVDPIDVTVIPREWKYAAEPD